MKKFILFILIGNINLFAQLSGSDGVTDFISSSAGNTYTTTSSGVFAIGKNPANLYNKLSNRHFEISTVLPLPSLSLLIGQEFMTFEQFNYYFGGVEINGEKKPRFLNEDDKNKLRELMSDGGTASFNFSINYLSLLYFHNKKVGGFAFSIDDIMGLSIRLPKDLVEIGLNGNPLNSFYNFNDSRLSTIFYRTYSFSYSRTISDIIKTNFDDLSFGLSLKLIKGYMLLKTEKVFSEIKTLTNSDIEINGEFIAYSSFSPDFGLKYSFENEESETKISPFPEPAGSGFGFDIGFSADYDETWRFGISFTDIGSIKFDKKLAKFQSNIAFVLTDITDESQIDSLSNSIKSDAQPFNESISSALPTAMHIGASAKLNKFFKSFPGQFIACLDIHKGFNNVLANSKTLRAAVGLYWSPWKAFQIRSGISFGGSFGSSLSFGIGFDLGPVEFGFSSYKFSSILKSNASNYFSLTLGSRCKF